MSSVLRSLFRNFTFVGLGCITSYTLFISMTDSLRKRNNLFNNYFSNLQLNQSDKEVGKQKRNQISFMDATISHYLGNVLELFPMKSFNSQNDPENKLVSPENKSK